jgi:molybdate transport system substrate-binding protein
VTGRSLAASLGIAAALLAGCNESTARGDGSSAAASGEVTGELVVFAAASLTDAFEAVVVALRAEHPDLQVVLNLGGSQTLAGQLREGATADVFASAADAQMEAVVAEELASDPVAFATNRLAIVVEPGNPLGIRDLGDLARDDVVLVLAAEEVPAGRYAAEALATAGVEVSPVSLEVDVRAVLSKVALGEADAGIVYRSDVVAAGGRVDGIAIPPQQNLTVTYPLAVLDDAPNPTAARRFVAFVRSEAGQRILREHGFETVP